MTLVLKSLDTMKASRDQNPAWSNALIVEHVGSLNQTMPDATHYTVASYQNNFSFYSIAKINEWFDAVHATGKKVFFRPALTSQMPSYAVDGALATDTDDYIEIFLASVHNFHWEDGDIWDVWPESNPSASIYNSHYGLGAPASWNAFIRDAITALEAEFVIINKDVDVGVWSTTDQTAVFGTKLELATIAACGNKICVDFYPMDIGSMRAKIQSCIGQLARVVQNYPGVDVWVTEIGYNNTTFVNDEEQRNLLRHFFNELATVPFVKGLNYWHGYGNSAFDKCLIWNSLSRTSPRPAAISLGEFFKKGQCSNRLELL